jgi:hypothetical protein
MSTRSPQDAAGGATRLRHVALVGADAFKSHLPRLVFLTEWTRSTAMRRFARTSNAALGSTNALAQSQRARAQHPLGTSAAGWCAAL